jgi:threonine dehydrogenase-like Zn-dependent dehydrogenase
MPACRNRGRAEVKRRSHCSAAALLSTRSTFGDAMNKGLTIRTNQCPVKRQWPRLFEHVRNGVLKPSAIVTHRIPLDEIAEGYHLMSNKLDGCIKPLVIPTAH